MKKLFDYKPLYFLVHLILGILFQYHYKVWRYDSIPLIILIFFFLIGLFLLRNLKVYFTICSLITFTVIGILSVYIQNPKNYTNYYTYQTNHNSKALLSISKVLKPTMYYDKYIAEVIQVDDETTQGKVLINIKKDSTKEKLDVDTQLFLKPEFKNLSPPLNPYQFNYKNYLAKQYVFHQVFTNHDQFLISENKPISLTGFIVTLRNHIKTSLEKYHFSKEELTIMYALLLGQRKGISTNLLNSYIKAGVVHILAISGLHIGILLLILSSFLSPLDKLKHGSILKTILLIMLLWSFAFFTGLSASVVRAVTMFTFLTIGNSFKKKKCIEYSLITSMLFMLLIKPLLLYDIGFQLSYIAVFSIIWIQPLIYKIWSPKYSLIDKVWQLITVSLAAQIGISPISFYYFHQFPGLFLLSNIVIILFLGTILLGGILCILLAVTNILPSFMVTLYGSCIQLMNTFIKWVALQEDFLFTNIFMSLLMMLCFYLFIICSFQFITQTKVKQLISLLVSILFIQFVFIYEKTQRNTKHQFIIFHKNKTSIIVQRIGKELFLLNKIDTLLNRKEKILNSFITGEGITLKEKNKRTSLYSFKKETILLVDSLGIYNIENLKKPIVILQNAPKINLIRLIKELNPKQIIADGSNYKSSIKKWEETCLKEKTPFYYTGKNGACIIN